MHKGFFFIHTVKYSISQSSPGRDEDLFVCFKR